MKNVLVIDNVGNRQEFELDDIPPSGELVMREYGAGSDDVQKHYFRVQEVLHNLQGAPGRQTMILLGEETSLDWP